MNPINTEAEGASTMTTNHPGSARSCRVLAYDQRRQHYLGSVADLAPDRLVLLSDAPLHADQILELRLSCSDPLMGLDGAYVGTRVLWSEAQGGSHWSGLQVISLAPAIRQQLAQLRVMSSPLGQDAVASLSA